MGWTIATRNQDLDHWKIINDYKSGKSIEAIAKESGLKQYFVASRILSEDVPLRKEDEYWAIRTKHKVPTQGSDTAKMLEYYNRTHIRRY